MGWGQKVRKQLVRFRFSLGPKTHITSLTFVRNSHVSHGTVGRITWPWSARDAFESEHLPRKIFFIDTILNFPGLFPFDSYQKYYISPTFSQWLTKYSADFCRYFVISLLPLFFSRSQRNIQFFPNCFHGILFKACKCSLYQAEAGNCKKSILRIFLVLRDKKSSTKNRDAPCYGWNFSIPAIFGNTEGFP